MADDERSELLDRIEAWRRRPARLTDDVITMAHGAGGKASQTLIDTVFRPAFDTPFLDALDDGAALTVPTDHEVVVSTDAFVVTPRRFPGGSLGAMAVHGTVNDVAVMGATPRWITVSFVLEEGLSVDELREHVADLAAAAAAVGVQVVTGDTKVVERGAADGFYVTTTGVGIRPVGCRLGAASVQPGDRVLVSGTIGDHGMAIMLARGDLHLDADLRSDTAPVHELVSAVLDAAPGTRWMRDPTRGGVASACNELAMATELAVELDEAALPVRPAVAGACELLGIDPLYVANEGKLLAVVPDDEHEAALDALRSMPSGAQAAVIGTIAPDPAGLVVLVTAFGGRRVVDLLVGDPLPRIC